MRSPALLRILPFAAIASFVACSDGGAGERGAVTPDSPADSVGTVAAELTPECGVAPARTVSTVVPWPDGLITYQWGASLQGDANQAQRAAIRAAMDTWQTKLSGAVQFRELANGRVMIGYGTSTMVGSCPDDPVVYANMSSGNAKHELGHLIGLDHQQQRSDRDRFIIVQHATCGDGNYPQQAVSDGGGGDIGPYTFNSVMHYRSFLWPSVGAYDMVKRSDLTPIFEGYNTPDPPWQTPSSQDVSNYFELTSPLFGPWTKFRSTGVDLGPAQPLSSNLAGGVQPAIASTPAVAKHAKFMELYARGADGSLHFRRSSSNGKPVWGSWTPVSLPSGVTLASDPTAAVVPGTTSIAVAFLGSDQNVWVNVQNASGNFVSPFTSLGKPAGTTLTSAPTLGQSGPSQLKVLVNGSDTKLWYSTYGAGGWSGGWNSLGAGFQGAPAVAYRAPYFYVYVNANGALMQNYTSNGADAQPTWGAWTFTDIGADIAYMTSPVAVSSASDRIDVFYRATDGHLRWTYWRGSSWTTAQKIGGLPVSNPAVAVGGPSRTIEMFARMRDQNVWHRRHIAQANVTTVDFDNDGKKDRLRFRAGEWAAYYGGAEHVIATWGGAGDVPVAADWDRDGITDLAYFRPSDGSWHVQESGSTPMVARNTFNFGGPGDIPVPGDYDGDELIDRAYFHADGTWHIRPSRGGVDWTISVGVSGDKLVPGDYDGDGKMDPATFHATDGTWHIRLSTTGSESVMQFGGDGDVPVPGDYDGDGKVDLAIFRPSFGTWFVHPSAGGVDLVQAFGTQTDRPMPGDYDGDGRTDYAYYSQATQTWKVRYRSGGDASTVVPSLSTDTLF